MKKLGILLTTLSLFALIGCSNGGGGGSEEPGETTTVNFYVDFGQTEIKYTMEVKPGSKISLPDEAKLTDADAIDPAFPYFLGYSMHPMINSTDDLWDFGKDKLPEEEAICNFYGIWVENK